MGMGEVVKKYENLLDNHLNARKKYYEMYYRADDNQRKKLENNFYRTLDQLREFEQKLNTDQKEFFESKYDGLEPDATYSSNREIPFDSEIKMEEIQIDDIHLLPTQKSDDFRNI